jgi:hypothetical protein
MSNNYTSGLVDDVKQLQDQLTALQKQVNELKGSTPVVEQEWPQKDDNCYCIVSTGSVAEFIWSGTDADNDCLKQGIYRTREAAEMEALRRECRASRPKVDWESESDRVWFPTGKSSALNFYWVGAVSISLIDSGLYGRTEEEARERWDKYGKAFEYLIENHE